MSIRRLIRDRALLNIDWRTTIRCDICGHSGRPYKSTRYCGSLDHCLRCHSHTRKRELAWWAKCAMFKNRERGAILEIAPGGQLSEMLRRRYRGYISLRHPPFDATCLPLADNSVDVVVSCEVIEHFKNPAVAMREINRVLVPGGSHFSAVFIDQNWTIGGDDIVLGYHQDEDGGRCPVYTLLGNDLPKVVAGWIGDSCARASLQGGVLWVEKRGDRKC